MATKRTPITPAWSAKSKGSPLGKRSPISGQPYGIGSPVTKATKVASQSKRNQNLGSVMGQIDAQQKRAKKRS